MQELITIDLTIFYAILAAFFVLSMLSLAGSATKFVAAYEKANRRSR